VKNKKRRVLPVAIALMAIIALSGVAYAYWSSTGTGTGSAGVGNSVPFTVSQTGSVSGLVPGGTAQDVTVNVSNTAGFSQSVTAITVSVNATAHPTCLATWFTLVQPSGPYPFAIAGGGNHDFVGTIAMTNDVANQDACKGLTINLDFAVS
jgi:hypothetical protein